MPIRKFHSVSDIPPAPPRPALDPENLRIACDLSRLARELRRVPLAPGVRKYHGTSDPTRRR